MRGLIVDKESTEPTDSIISDLISEVSNTELLTDTEYDELSSNSDNVKVLMYKRPLGGTRQDNLTKDDILKMLNGYVPLRTMEEKKALTKLKCFKTWVRYINMDKKLFRIGGILTRVVYPDYIMLMTPKKDIVWSVQLNNSIIYVKPPGMSPKEKEKAVKEKLYQLYKAGQLQRM